MATAKQFEVRCDERYPDFDITESDKFTSKYARTVTIDPELYQKFLKITEEYDKMQEILGDLYAKAKKSVI